MVYLYKSVNPKKIDNPPKVIFKTEVNYDPSSSVCFTFGRGLRNDLWNFCVINNKGILATLCPLDLSKWNEE